PGDSGRAARDAGRHGASGRHHARKDLRGHRQRVCGAVRRRPSGRRMTTVPVREIPGPAGRLEAILEEPASVRAAVVFAHPHPQYGGTMHTKVVYQSAKAFARIGCAVLRFNYRGVGTSEGAWDEGRGETEDFRAAVDFMHARYPGIPLWAAGMSFGAWIALTVGAEDTRISTLLGIAPPL